MDMAISNYASSEKPSPVLMDEIKGMNGFSSNESNPAFQVRIPDYCDFLRDDLSQFYDFLPIGYLTLDANGTIRTANHTAAEMLGMPKRCLVQSDFSRYLLPEDQKRIRKNGYKLTDFIRSDPFDLRLTNNRGQIWARISLLQSGEGRRVNRDIHLALQDVTGQKQTERELGWQLKVIAEIETISNALSQPEPDYKNISQLVLMAAIHLTQSKQGFISRFPSGSRHPREMILELMFPDTGQETGTLCFSPDDNGHYCELLGQSLNNLKPFFTNPPLAHHPSNRLPQSHIPIDGFLSVPILLDRIPVGMIVVANPENNYSQRHVQVVSRLVKLYTIALTIQRLDREKEALAFPRSRVASQML